MEFNWFESQRTSDSIVMHFIWFEIQLFLSVHLRFNRFEIQMVWDSSDLVASWFEGQAIWLLIDSSFK